MPPYLWGAVAWAGLAGVVHGGPFLLLVILGAQMYWFVVFATMMLPAVVIMWFLLKGVSEKMAERRDEDERGA